MPVSKRHIDPVREAEERAKKRGSLMIWALLLATTLLVASQFGGGDDAEETRKNHADRARGIVPLDDLHDLRGGWVGEVNRTWSGLDDREVAQAACWKLHKRLDLVAPETVTLLAPSGIPVVECGAE